MFDVESREATHLETWRPVWVSVDGELLGLWDTETGVYQVRDRSGNVERTLGPGLVSMGEDFVADGHVVGLEGGVLYVEGQVENASAAEGFARFEGFEGSSALVWDQEAGMSVHGALSVPGAVTVLYDIDGERAVMGLR